MNDPTSVTRALQALIIVGIVVALVLILGKCNR
jgi:hypothetical protein